MAVVLTRDQVGRSVVQIHCDTCPRCVRSNVLSEDALRDAVMWTEADATDACTECQRRRGMTNPYLVRIEQRVGRLA